MYAHIYIYVYAFHLSPFKSDQCEIILSNISLTNSNNAYIHEKCVVIFIFPFENLTL